jgi:hypothetical protein
MSGVETVKASVLTLVSLLLGFSYSIAADHYDRRVQVVVSEARALNGCWMCTDLADEPVGSRARDLLRSIVDARLSMIDQATDAEADDQTEDQITGHKRELWKLATGLLHQSAEPEKHFLLVESVTDVIDRGGERTAAFADRVPGPVTYLLIACILVSALLMGLSSGQDNRRIPLLWSIVIILMVVVLTLTFDLDHPGRGLVTEWSKPLEEMKTLMSHDVD